jgi:outer membrane protein assembly factor BamB
LEDGSLIFGGCDGNAHRLEGQTGALIQDFEIGNYLAASPSGDNRQAFIGAYNGSVIALNCRTGGFDWQLTLENEPALVASPAITDTTLIIAAKDGNAYAIDRQNGTILWHFDAGSALEASPLIIGPWVVLASADGYIYQIALASGALEAEFATNETIIATPAFAGRDLVIAGRAGTITVLGPSDQEQP